MLYKRTESQKMYNIQPGMPRVSSNEILLH